MATPIEDFLAEGRALRVAAGDPTVPTKSQFDPEQFLQQLSFEEQLNFGRQRREGIDDVTALREIFGKDRTILGEPFRGVGRGLGQLGDIGLGLGALGASAVGAEETMQAIGGRLEERQLRRSITNAPLQGFEGAFDNPGNFVTWLAGVVGEQVPIVTSIIASGGVGTLIGRALAQRAITKQAASKAMNFAIRHSGEAGLFTASTAVGTGSTAGELLRETGTINVPVAIIAGVVQGALEGLTPLAFASSFGIVDSVLQKRFLRLIADKIDDIRKRPTKALVSAMQTGPVEGATEFLQTAVDLAARSFVDENFDALSPESKRNLLESAVTGTFAGATFGGLVGAVAPQTGVPSDAPLARFTDDGDPEINPPAPKPEPRVVAAETIDETTPFTFVEDDQFVDFAQDLTQEFYTGDRALGNLGVKGNTQKDTRFFRLDEAGAEQTALLEDLPSTADQLTLNSGVSFVNEGTRDEALALAKEAIDTRNQTLEEVFGADRTVPSFAGSQGLLAARKLHKKAIDLGFRFPPRENSGFVLVKPVSETALTEVNFVPRDSIVIKSSEAVEALDFSLTDDPVVVPKQGDNSPIIPFGGTLMRDLPKTSRTIGPGGFARTPGAELKARRFRIDASRLPLEKLRIGAVTGFRQLARAFAPAGISNLTEEEAITIVEAMDRGGHIVFGVKTKKAIKARIDLLVKTLLTQEASSSRVPFWQALRKGVEIIPTRDILSFDLYFKGDMSDLDFQLAASQIPAVPRFYNDRKLSMNGSTVNGWKTSLKNSYAPVDKDGNSVTGDEKGLTAAYGTFAGNETLGSIGARDIKKTVSLITGLAKKVTRAFGLGNKNFVLIFSNQSSFKRGATQAADDGSFYININVNDRDGVLFEDNFNNKAKLRLISTLMHELGHVMHFTLLSKLPKHMIEQLRTAYMRDSFKAELTTVSDAWPQYGALPAFLGSLRIQAEGKSIGIGLPLADPFLAGDSDFHVNYLLSFDEWFAEQMAKWAFTEGARPEPLTKLEKFLRAIARTMEKYFTFFTKELKSLGLVPADFKPADAFRAFVDEVLSSPPGTFISPPVIPSQTPKVSKALGVAYEETAAVSPSRNLIESVIKNTPKITPEQKTKLLETATAADYFNGLMKWGYNILQTGRLNPDNQTLQDYIAQTRQWHIESTQWKARVSENIRKWERLGKVQADALGRFIFEIEQMTYLTDQEHKDGKFRRPTTEELNVIAARHKLVEQSKDVYQLIVKDFDDFLRVVETVEENRIKKEFAGSPNLRAKLDKVTKEYDRLRKKPYFPHARFGQTAVVIKDLKGKTRYMEQVEGPLFSISHKLATKRAREIEKKLNKSETMQAELQVEDGFKISVVKIPEQVQPFRGLPPTMLKMIEDKLLKTPEGKTPTSAELSLIEQQRIWLKELIVDMSPTNSFRKRLGKRENIPGYSRDAMRSYADYFWHGSNFLARLTHGLAMQDTLIAGEKDLSDRVKAGIDTVKRRQILEYLQDHFTNIMNPGPDWAQLRSASFSWWLGFVPASAMLNLTQVPMVALPFLSTQFGTVKTLNALRKAYADIIKLNKDPVKALEETGDILFKHLALAMKQGFVDESWATEIAATATSGNLMRMRHGSQLSRAVGSVGHAAAWMFQASEAKVNRRVVFRAALELARADPNSAYLQELVRVQKTEFDSLVKDEKFSETEAKAFLAGRDAVDRSQFEYASWARPRFMRGRLGVLFMFFMFVQNSTFFAIHEPGRIRYMLMLMAMAGIMGLPGAEDMAAIAQFIARRLGMRLNVEEEVSRFVVDNFGGAIPPDLLLHGASRFGFGIPAAADMIGIPLPVFDMSASISMGGLIPGLRELGPPGRDFDRRFSRISTDVAGATFGIGINFLKMMSDSELPWSDIKRWERGVPRALKNVMRAGRYALEGEERTRSGATFVEFDTDEFEDIGEILLAGAGFQPRKLTREWDRVAAKREVETYWSLRRNILMKQFGIAALAGDKEAMADMIKAIKRYNNDVPFRTMAITRKSLRTSRKERLRRRRLEEAGISQTKMFQPLSQDLNRLFPSDKGGVVDVQDVSRIR